MTEESNRGRVDRTPSTPSSPSRTATQLKRGGSKKISRRLVLLGATTILAVYAAGFVGSNSAASQASAPVSHVGTTQVSSAASASPPATSTTTTAVGQYKDGTYVGQGNSRHGGIQVSVVVQSGKIVSAGITQATTRYPTSRIASLPSTVVAQQSTQVDVVSGATDSSMAYLAAVDSALTQAV
jgi:uncharacterized protein with FMN-binding domain